MSFSKSLHWFDFCWVGSTRPASRGFFYAMHYCYVVYSAAIDRHYVGETECVYQRLLLHNTHRFSGSFTMRASDWKVVLELECRDREHARAVERHIKKMKSRKYLDNLIRYEELRQKLLGRF